MHINYDSCYLFPQHVVSIFGRAEELGLVECSAARSQREECVSYCSDIIIHSCQIIQQLLRLLHVLPHTASPAPSSFIHIPRCGPPRLSCRFTSAIVWPHEYLLVNSMAGQGEEEKGKHSVHLQNLIYLHLIDIISS